MLLRILRGLPLPVLVALLVTNCQLANLTSAVPTVPPPALTVPPQPSPTAPGFANTPEGVVSKILYSIQSQDANGYLDALDPDLRKQPNYFMGATFSRGILAAFGLGSSIDVTKISFRDVRVQTRDSNGKVAHVQAIGKIRNLALATEDDFQGTFATRNINGSWFVSDENLINPTPTPVQPVLAIILLDASKQATKNQSGFVTWVAHIAITNRGNATYVGGWPYRGTLRTKEGFDYDATAGHDDPDGWSQYALYNPFAAQWLLPPGFAVTGEGLSKLSVHASIGEKTTPTSLYLQGFPPIDLDGAQTKPTFPTSRPDSEFASVPNTFEIPGIAKISVESFQTSVEDGKYPTIWMRYKYENLNLGKAQNTPDMLLTAVNAEGLVQSWTHLSRGNRGCPYGAVAGGWWQVGPGQTTAVDLCWSISMLSQSPQGLKASTKGMKVIMYLKDYRITKIYNTGF